MPIALSQKSLSHFSQYRVRYAVGAAIFMIWFLYAQTRQPPPMYICGPELRHSLQESEAEYQETVRQRKAMIHRYGPTPDKVEAWPTHGEYYVLWDFFPPAYQCPHRVTRLGTLGDGGKYICGMKRIAAKKDCVVYSFGLNGESSFEADILQRAPGCQVYGYDFSVTSFGPEIAANPNLALRAHFFPYALGHVDAHMDTPPMYTLQSLMLKNGHTFIDILKIDIEGNEYKSLEVFMDAYASTGVLPFGQLQIEIHASGGTGHESFAMVLPWWERLEKFGLRPFFSEPNLVYVNIARGVPNLAEYAFINTRGTHELVADLV